jgi:hypothetical protein
LTPLLAAAAPPTPPPYPFEKEAPADNGERTTTREVALRSRWLSVPHGILDTYYYRGTEPGWAYLEGRPSLTAHALGIEASLRDGRHQVVFYVEYIDATFDAGYFDDVDDGTPNHLDGIFLEPGPWLGLAAVGADYVHVIPLLKPEHTAASLGISLSFGVGAGLGVVTGELSSWDADDVGNPAYKRYLDGTDRDEAMSLPPVIPLVDVLAKLSFDLGERATIYADGGIHTALYWGVGAGVAF